MLKFPKEMKRLFTLLLVLLLVAEFNAQVPVMNPIDGPAIACSAPGAPSSFTASASNNPTLFNWSCNPSFGVTFSSYTTSVVNVSFPQGMGIYTLSCFAQNGSGFSAPVEHVIYVLETPEVTFSGSQTSFCQGSSTMLMASATSQAASSTISYNWSPATGLSSSSSYSVMANPSVSTTYTVVASLGSCHYSVSVPVTVRPLPTFTVSSSHNPLCPKQTATVTIAGATANIFVNSSASAPVFTLTPASTSTYTIIGSDQYGCTGSATFVQNVSLCLAVQEVQQVRKELFVYPNPTQGSFTIRSSYSSPVRILDQLGKEVRHYENRSQEEIEISGLSPGMYFILAENRAIRLIVTK